MKRRKRTWYATDEEYRPIQDAAQAAGVDVSEYVRKACTVEIRRHVRKKGLKDMICEIVRQELNRLAPTQDDASEGKKIQGGL